MKAGLSKMICPFDNPVFDPKIEFLQIDIPPFEVVQQNAGTATVVMINCSYLKIKKSKFSNFKVKNIEAIIRIWNISYLL
jgi:hypothetical protein